MKLRIVKTLDDEFTKGKFRWRIGDRAESTGLFDTRQEALADLVKLVNRLIEEP